MFSSGKGNLNVHCILHTLQLKLNIMSQNIHVKTFWHRYKSITVWFRIIYDGAYLPWMAITPNLVQLSKHYYLGLMRRNMISSHVPGKRTNAFSSSVRLLPNAPRKWVIGLRHIATIANIIKIWHIFKTFWLWFFPKIPICFDLWTGKWCLCAFDVDMLC